MAALTFDKCCCCIELKTGCFIIGYLSLIGYGIFTILALIALGGGAYVASTQDKDHGQDTGIIVIVAAVFFLLIVAFALTFVIVLLVGLHKNKPGHVKAYLIYGTIFLVLSIVQLIVVICSPADNSKTYIQSGDLQIQTNSSASHGSDIASKIINLLLTAYFLLVIRSQYLVMKDGDRRGPAIYSAA